MIIARRGRPVARLVSYRPRGKRQPDVLKGKITVPDSVFDPLPERELKAWEGGVCRVRIGIRSTEC